MKNSQMESVDPLVQRMRSLRHDSPDLSKMVRLYEAILPLLRDADLHVAPVFMTPEQAQAKMAKGLPLLHDIDLEIDDEAALELMLLLARAVEQSNENDQARQIRSALEEHRLDAGSLLTCTATGDRNAVTSIARHLNLNADLVWTLAQNTLRPALRVWCRQLAHLSGGIPWQKGSCYVCGAAATLAELQGNNLAKHLRCGQCGADWQFPRLQCMYCGNEDHHTLKHFYTESHLDTMRVEVCDKCHGYLKVMTSFAPTAPEMLAIEDLATLHLDTIAVARGYEHGAIS
jgi:formate dehydrogenase maturation protein FdhE